MKRFYYFLYGWAVTLRIKFFEPELYRALTKSLDMTDFGEVKRP